MKRRNMSKSIAQKGGLMIEALAMLGLIAVVTPTMYKKSAERTMEVEDINTASTIRTVMNAANDYVGANYSTIVSEMEHSTGNASNYRKITFDQIKNYLPYGFNMKKALYNYGDPEISIARKDNNLTAFVLFPAKANADNGIGQERTSRIASLVGSSGGFVTEKGKTARGIGGVWKLEETDYKGVFPDKAENAEEYSIVTASADTINSAVNNEVDMDKYLQRGRDAGDTDSSSLWKNTMRTDLYMGNTDIANDVYNDEEKYKDKTFSIRNVKSMIIGAEYAGGDKDLDEASNYGLYVTGNKPNTYLSGTLEAVDSDFRVLQDQLSFGRTVGADGNKGDYAFTIANNGDTSTRGQLIVDKNIELAAKFPTADTAGWDSIKIGALSDGANPDYIIQANHQKNPKGYLTFFNDNIMRIQPEWHIALDYGGFVPPPGYANDRIVMMDNGFNQIFERLKGGGGAYNNIPKIQYSFMEHMQAFPVRIGSNTRVDGLLAAGQIDTQKLRLATLSAGSEHIDDANKWMTVDADGVLIANPENREAVYDNTSGKLTSDKSGTRVNISKDQIALSVDSTAKSITNPREQEESEHLGKIVLNTGDDNTASALIQAPTVDVVGTEKTTISGKGTLIQAHTADENEAFLDNDLDDNSLVLRNSEAQMRLAGKEIRIGGRTNTLNDNGFEFDNPNEIRTIFDNGTVDVANANLNVYTDDNTNKKQVFSVRTNNAPNSDSPTNTYADNYDITMHGKVLITNEAGGKVATGATDADTTNKAHKLISIGGDTIQTDAGINIIQRSDDAQISNAYKNILIIEQGATDEVNKNSNNNNSNNNGINTDDGTIYIRKGFVEIHGEGGGSSGNKDKSADQGLGVIKASRFVANNPDITEASMTGKPYSSGKYGARVPILIKDKEWKNYYGENSKPTDGIRYDTYMVNPAYTSVMHDIKLTTRGGARLSDVLPDFINKGIYVVNNTVKESSINSLDFSSSTYDSLKGKKDAFTKDQKLDLAKEEAWASPFLGVVPAPQCPPGYGRVITLTPATFQVGQAGKLMKRNDTDAPANSYYVVPNDASSDQIDASANNLQVAYEKVGVIGKATDKNNQEIDIKPDKVTTAKYVLTTFSDTSTKQPVVPLTFQQSTWLKSMVKELKNGDYTQGWATIMGFLYPTSLYNGFTHQDKLKATDEAYWNIFPVLRGSLEGYATVYCYFDRTNMYSKTYSKDGTEISTGLGYVENYDTFVDNYDYLQTMDHVPTSFKKKSGDPNYQKRLNDPSLKYDEVW